KLPLDASATAAGTSRSIACRPVLREEHRTQLATSPVPSSIGIAVRLESRHVAIRPCVVRHRVRLVRRRAEPGPRDRRPLADSPAFPPVFSNPIGVADPLRHRVIVVDAALSNDPVVVHVFETTPTPHWSILAADGPSPKTLYLASLVYDSARDRVILIGSHD